MKPYSALVTYWAFAGPSEESRVLVKTTVESASEESTNRGFSE